jgi:protein O-GlcNAc transferase
VKKKVKFAGNKPSSANGVLFNKIHSMPPPPTMAPSLPQLLSLAVSRHQAGQTGVAESLYQQCLARDPSNVSALNLLGVLKIQAGQPAQALDLLQKAIELQPNYAEAFNNLGLAQKNLHSHPEAEAAYRTAIRIKPNYPEALNNLATVLRERGDLAGAISACGQAIALRPAFAQAYNTRGTAYHASNQLNLAISDLDKAIELAPNLATAHFNRGVLMSDLFRHEEALRSYDLSLSLYAENAMAWNNRGFSLDCLQRHSEAIQSFDQAIRFNPRFIQAFLNKGNSLHELKNSNAALSAFEHAIQIEPTYADAWMAKGQVLTELKQFGLAKTAFEMVCQYDPSHKYATGAVVGTMLRMCQWEGIEQKIASIHQDVEDGNLAILPFEYLALTDSSEKQLRCSQSHAADQAIPGEYFPADVRTNGSKIKLAYLSADFHDHATAHLMVEVFEKHDRSQFEVSAWSYGPATGDPMQRRLKEAFDQFYEVNHLSDSAVANLLYQANIDIAIDLKGHTHGSRTPILAARPARVQAQYLGYPGTLGLDYIDFILADDYVIPKDHDANYSERVIRLPNSYQPNCQTRDVSSITPNRQRMGLPDQAFVFCCFNNNYKITPHVFAIWMRLLNAIENSVLWLLKDSAAVEQNLRREAERAGIAVNRIIFADRVALPDHLARHRLADLFLDTFPVNAHTTASDALWMGLPLLTCSGDGFASRVAGSLLKTAGIPDLITTNLSDYESRAHELAQNRKELDQLREKLISNRNSCALFDSASSARSLECAFIEMLKIGPINKSPSTMEKSLNTA